MRSSREAPGDSRTRERVVPVLIGPAERPFLDLRRDAAARLREKGHTALVLEEYPERDGELLRDKWARMLDAEAPTHFFIVLAREPSANGAHVEFGFLMGRYGQRELERRVSFFLENGLDPADALAVYEFDFAPRCGIHTFRDADSLVDALERCIHEVATGARAESA